MNQRDISYAVDRMHDEAKTIINKVALEIKPLNMVEAAAIMRRSPRCNVQQLAKLVEKNGERDYQSVYNSEVVKCFPAVQLATAKRAQAIDARNTRRAALFAKADAIITGYRDRMTLCPKADGAALLDMALSDLHTALL